MPVLSEVFKNTLFSTSPHDVTEGSYMLAAVTAKHGKYVVVSQNGSITERQWLQ